MGIYSDFRMKYEFQNHCKHGMIIKQVRTLILISDFSVPNSRLDKRLHAATVKRMGASLTDTVLGSHLFILKTHVLGLAPF